MGSVVSILREFPRAGMPSSRRAPQRVARILRPGYVAEVIRDASSLTPIFHWIVQAAESGEVLALGQAETLGEAERSAVYFLDDLRLRRAI